MNLARNEVRFETGKHYHKLTGPELRNFKHSPTASGLVPRNAPQLLLWTERGAARHAKLLDTDQAWAVFERLEESYFRVRPEPMIDPIPFPTAPRPKPLDAEAVKTLLRHELSRLAPLPSMAATLPPDQCHAILDPLRRLMGLFHPHSNPFLDLLSISRAVHGRDPQLGLAKPGWVPVLPAEPAK